MGYAPAAAAVHHCTTPHVPQVRCLNEAVEGSCRKVFKPWHLRQEAPSGEPGAQLGAAWGRWCCYHGCPAAVPCTLTTTRRS